jgi:hypothetical protein
MINPQPPNKQEEWIDLSQHPLSSDLSQHPLSSDFRITLKLILKTASPLCS